MHRQGHRSMCLFLTGVAEAAWVTGGAADRSRVWSADRDWHCQHLDSVASSQTALLQLQGCARRSGQVVWHASQAAAAVPKMQTVLHNDSDNVRFANIL